MKRLIFGILIVMIGLVYSVFFLVYAANNPWDYHGITGLKGSLLGTETYVPFIISLLAIVTGLVISWYESYKRK